MARIGPAVLDLVDLLRARGISVDQSAAIRDNLYLLDGRTQLLVRSSKYFPGRDCYFFGLTRSVLDQYVSVPDAYIAFVCGDAQQSYVLPVSEVASWLPDLSADKKQYKLVVTQGRLRFTAASGRPPLDLGPHLNVLPAAGKARRKNLPVPPPPAANTHTDLQAMLLEIGNRRGHKTYCPDRKPRFHGQPLGRIASLRDPPVIPGVASDVARRVDVLWFDDETPVDAFEVELTTGIWSGLVRLGEFLRLSTRLHVVTDGDARDFQRKIGAYVFKPMVQRCGHVSAPDVRRLHAAELQVADLRDTLRV